MPVMREGPQTSVKVISPRSVKVRSASAGNGATEDLPAAQALHCADGVLDRSTFMPSTMLWFFSILTEACEICPKILCHLSQEWNGGAAKTRVGSALPAAAG